MKPAGIACQRTIVAHDAMARNNDRNPIMVISQAHGARRAALSQALCDITVGARLAVRDVEKFAPNGDLKCRAVQIERKIELGALAFEVFLDLFDENSVRRQIFDSAPWNSPSEFY